MTSSKDIKEIIAASAYPERGLEEYARFCAAFEDATGDAFVCAAVAPLLHLFGNSRVLTERLIAHPAWAMDFCDRTALARPRTADVIADELQQAIAAFDTHANAAFDATLRRFKYQALLRLLLRDRTLGAPVAETLAEWSDAAEACIDAAYARAHRLLTERHGAPRTGEGAPCSGTIIALGKLGARELNASSDVDLLVLYETDEGETAGGLSNHEFYVRLAAAMTRTLSAVTPEGFVFRVDHELRPEGPQGPLANSLPAAERYYQYFGQEWERGALVRARPVAGDRALGAAVLETLRPFVYRRALSIADLGHLREMKERIERAALAKHGAYDLKAGVGGIREAEFFVQALQLLSGGAEPELRVTNTFDAIDVLERRGRIHPHTATLLREGYGFLRRAENALQIEDDRQTHRLPEGAKERAALARRMGSAHEDAAASFERERARHTDGIRRLFHGLFAADYELLELESAMRENLARSADEEEEADSLAWFRRQEFRRIQRLDAEGALPLPRVLQKLSSVAAVVVQTAWEIAARRLVERHGRPRRADGAPAGFAVLAFGKLGSGEIDYGSDLDLCFLYEGAGESDGARPISNAEFFTKLAQRIISKLSLPTRYGKAFEIDAELRPSGHQGTLVTSSDAFERYHRSEAQIWERLALLRARPIAGDEPFREALLALLDDLLDRAPPPADAVRAEIAHLRERALAERAGEGEHIFNLKIGDGSAGDLESIIACHQLLHAHALPALRRRDAFAVLDVLACEGIIASERAAAIGEALGFFRRAIALLRAFAGRSIDRLDLRTPAAEALAERMGFATPAELRAALEERRRAVRALVSVEITAEKNPRRSAGLKRDESDC